MAWFKVIVHSTNEFTYEVEAESISEIHDLFDDSEDGIPEGWDCVNERFDDEEIESVREIDPPIRTYVKPVRKRKPVK